MEAIIIKNKEFKEFVETLNELKKALEENKNTNLKGQWLDNEEVGNILKVSKRTLQTYRDRGILPYSQIGNKIYYKADDIQSHLENNYINLSK